MSVYHLPRRRCRSMTFLDPFILPMIVVRPFCVLRRCDNSAGATERKEAREGGTLAAYNLCVPSFHWIWTSLVCQSETTGLTGPFRLVGGPTANRSRISHHVRQHLRNIIDIRTYCNNNQQSLLVGSLFLIAIRC